MFVQLDQQKSPFDLIDANGEDDQHENDFHFLQLANGLAGVTVPD